MPYIASNNGMSVCWHDPADGYQLKDGEASFVQFPTDDDLNLAFPNRTSALAAAGVPKVVTARQARRALAATPAPGGSNMLNVVNAWVAQQTDDIKIDWEFSTEIHRESGTVISAATALGMNSAQLDALFTLAGSFT